MPRVFLDAPGPSRLTGKASAPVENPQARVLESIGWDRVDIFNGDGMSPYKDLIVANEWLNGEGVDIVRHLVDNAPNRPAAEARRSGTQGPGQAGGGEVIPDLISGLDDDDDSEA